MARFGCDRGGSAQSVPSSSCIEATFKAVSGLLPARGARSFARFSSNATSPLMSPFSR